MSESAATFVVSNSVQGSFCKIYRIIFILANVGLHHRKVIITLLLQNVHGSLNHVI